MTALQTAVEELILKIQHASPSTHRVTVKMDLPANTDLIDWMDAQPVFPKFYWQSRDSREEVVALGQIKTFTDPMAAEKILADDQRVWGGRSFDGRSDRNRRCLSSFFFLPQCEVIRMDQAWHLAANIPAETQSRESLVKALHKFTYATTSISRIRAKVLSRSYAPDFSGWSNMIGQALDAISQKVFEKVVLARRTTLKLDNAISPAQLLKASRNSNTNSFHFMMALDAKHCFIGSTPERLFLRHHHDLKTEALAGTIGRGVSEAEDGRLAQWLLDDSKNRYENRLVVDDIVGRLNPCCQQLNVAQVPELVRLRKVQHLKRSIDGQLHEQVYNADLLDNLQPTAAIAGLPRDKALDFISEHEPFARGWYSGAVGFLSRQRSEFCVAIRSALIMGEEIHLFAGAGIVPGSTADSEWKELDRKTSTLYSLIDANLPDVCNSEHNIEQTEKWERQSA